MGRLTNDKKISLLKIEKARAILSVNLKNKHIDESDLIRLMQVNSEYGNTKVKNNDKKENILKNIFNCPFLLCDQEDLSLNVKKLLPIFLEYRYNTELNEIEYLYVLGNISYEEFEKEQKLLKFCYYESSKDGKSILENGKARKVKDNIIRYK